MRKCVCERERSSERNKLETGRGIMGRDRERQEEGDKLREKERQRVGERERESESERAIKITLTHMYTIIGILL